MQQVRYWFPAKRYGWGWGLPRTWEGWIVFAVYFVALPLGAYLFPPSTSMPEFVAYAAVITAALVVTCWVKGEPPAWRWGK